MRFFTAEILGLHVKGRLTLSGEELEALDSFQLGEAIHQVKQRFLERKSQEFKEPTATGPGRGLPIRMTGMTIVSFRGKTL